VYIKTSNLPQFKYGFTALAIPKAVLLDGFDPIEDDVDEQRIVMFGGCTQGGYSGDCAGKLLLYPFVIICMYSYSILL